LAVRRRAKLIAPELLAAECANILWKKVQRDELSKEEAFLAARLLQAADIEFLPTRHLLEATTRSLSNLIIRRMIASTSRWRLSAIGDLSLPTNVSCAKSGKDTSAGSAGE
jgi:hypothetical protein